MTKQTRARPVAAKRKAKPVATAIAKKSHVMRKPATKTSADAIAPSKSIQVAVEPLKRVKLVRDSFTMPREDFDRIARLKSRAIDFKRPAKKSELLRAGLQALERLDDASLHAALSTLRAIKTGRPKKRH